MGAVSTYNEDMKTSFRSFYSSVIHSCQVVVSFSSGSNNFINPRGDFMRVLFDMKLKSVTVNLIPFTENEFQKFSEKFPFSSSNDFKEIDYKHLTNYNPLLLTLIRREQQKEMAASIINETVKQFFANIMSSLKRTEFEWVKKSLNVSLEMLYLAANREKIPMHRFLHYTGSWVHAENITYISEKSDDFFMLGVNFPTYFKALREVLYDCKKNEKVRIHSPAIDGMHFEANICGRINDVDIVYSKKDESIATQPDVEPLKATFNIFIDHVSDTPVIGLLDGVLHHLRPFHPVLDAVAYVNIKDNPWLFLIQVSLSEYKSHRSKISDLTNKIQGIEKETNLKESKKKKETEPDCTWLEYYRQQLPENVSSQCKCMYLYISPENFVEPDTRQSLRDYDLRNSDKSVDVYFGCIMKGSGSAEFVKQVADNSRS